MEVRKTTRSHVCSRAMILLGLAATCTTPLLADDPAVAAESAQAASAALIQPDPLEPLLQAVGYRSLQETLEKELNVSLELGYTLIWQIAGDTQGRSDNLWSGSFDLSAEWTAFEHDQFGTGALGVLVESGHIIGQRNNMDLSENIGTILGVNDDLDNQALVVTELWWRHSLLDDKLTITVGKMDQTAFFDGNRVANDETAQFLATPLVNNPSIAAPDNGLGFNVTFAPDDLWYVSGGMGDAYADARCAGFNTIGDKGRFVAVEIGITPTIAERAGAYRVIGWHVEQPDGDGDGGGIALSFDQELIENVTAFFRYGYGDDEVADFEQFVSAGVGIESPFGRANDMVGVGFAWANPADNDSEEESLLELFYRIQLTDTVALTPDLQFVFDPAESADNDTVAVFALRLQATF